MKKVLILGVAPAQMDALLMLKESGYETYACAMAKDGPGASVADNFSIINILDIAEIIEYVCKNKIDLVYSVGSDLAMPVACKVSEQLSLPHFVSSKIATTCNHKDLMRNALGKSYRGNIPFQIVMDQELSLIHILGIGPGDEVITSAYTYTASASIINHVGAKIVLVDTAFDSFEMDYSQLAKAITNSTKMIIPVDIGGRICDYDEIYKVVESKKGLFKANNELQALFNRVIVMADAAHAFGAERKGMKCGQVTDFTCFSFHAVKNLSLIHIWLSPVGKNYFCTVFHLSLIHI